MKVELEQDYQSILISSVILEINIEVGKNFVFIKISFSMHFPGG